MRTTTVSVIILLDAVSIGWLFLAMKIGGLSLSLNNVSVSRNTLELRPLEDASRRKEESDPLFSTLRIHANYAKFTVSRFERPLSNVTKNQ